MRKLILPAIAAALLASPVPAAMTGSDTAQPTGPDLAALKRRIETGNATAAEQVLREANAADPGNADILNMLGYANRKLGRPGIARGFYEQALAIDAAHRGALEYMGELELEAGNAPAARVLLTRLRAACPTGCAELDDLIAAFESRGVATKPEGES